jgi:hypothetical protein
MFRLPGNYLFNFVLFYSLQKKLTLLSFFENNFLFSKPSCKENSHCSALACMILSSGFSENSIYLLYWYVNCLRLKLCWIKRDKG